MSKQHTLYFNNSNSKLYLITDELVEIHPNLIDHIQKNSQFFKISKTLKMDLPISKYKIQTTIDLEAQITPQPTPKPTQQINYYGFYPKLVTQNDLSNTSQIELAVYGEGYSYYNTAKNRLYFLKKDSKHYYWDEGQNLVGMMGAKGDKGEKGENGQPGENGERGAYLTAP